MEFPLIFLLVFLPAYLNQAPLPHGVFDYPLFHGQMILQSLLLFLMAVYLIRKDPPLTISEYHSAFAPELLPLQSLLSLAGLALIYAVYNFALLPLLSTAGDAAETAVLLTRPAMLPLSLISCLAAAAMEEFFFRGYAYIRLRETGIGKFPALAVVSVLFAAGHLYEGVPAAAFACGSGFFLGYLVIRGFSLYTLALSHGLFNFSMVLISYLSQL